MTREAVITRIHAIEAHEGADKLECAILFGSGGFCSIVGLNQYKAGDLVLYIEVDSVLSDEIGTWLAENSKISINNKRLRAAKIRGVISEGLILRAEEFLSQKDIVEDKDVSTILGITHYNPPPRGSRYGPNSIKGANTHYVNKYFHKYTHLERIEKYPTVLKEGEEVVVTIKIHGCNSRWFYGLKSDEERVGLWFKVKKFFGFAEDKEFLVGSHRTVRNKPGKKGKFNKKDLNKDIFCRAASLYKLEEITKSISKTFCNANVVIFAEVFGYDGEAEIQRGYTYGLPKNTLMIKVFDITINGRYVDFDELNTLCSFHMLPMVQVVYQGPFNSDVLKLAEVVDKINDWKGNREGIVIKPVKSRKDKRVGHVALKRISEKYKLDKSNSEHH